MSGTTSGLAQSVHARLIRHAQSLGVDPNLVLTRFATERLLYRLSRSQHAERFVLKGSLLLLMWLGETIRPTRDADLLGFGDLSDKTIAATFTEICTVNVEPDGIVFDPETIRVVPIRPEDAYGGRRVVLLARLGSARIPVQVDIGIGDAVVPAPEWRDYPSLLNLPRPRLRAYRPETVIAEKAHAMVMFGTTNSRMRDFFDVYELAQHVSFDGTLLATAILATFERRKTAVPEAIPLAFTPAFAQTDNKRVQWRAFLRKNRLTSAPKDLETVVAVLGQFLGPVFSAAARAERFQFVWQPGGPWMPTPGATGSSFEQSIEKHHTMSRSKPYAACKDYDAEWLAKIPEHWEVKRLRFLGLVNPPSGGLKAIPPSLGVSFMPMDALREWGGICLETTKQLSEVSSGYTCFRDGDVLVAKITPCFENGKGAVARGLANAVGLGTTELHVIRPGRRLCADFLAYVTFSQPFRCLGQVEMRGAAGQQRVPEEFIKNFPVPLPPLSEQHAIAAFLDRETARIDMLVTKNERLIELLQEKRSALISWAVTKGLDPNVPMKDSGVEWLGEMPAHWEVLPLKRMASLRAGQAITSEYIDDTGEYPVYGGNGVRGYTASFTHEGDFPLIGRQGALCGCINFASGRFWASEHAVVAAPLRGTDARWLTYLLSAMSLNQYSESAAQPGLAVGVVASIRAPRPPLAEQRAIAAFLDRETSKIDALISKVRDGIELLKEYRTALISAAVTGKIDVREEAPSQ